MRRQLEAVRSNLAGTPGATPIHQDTWSRVATPTPTPYGGAQHTPSYQALSRGMNYGAAPTGARKTGVDAYYTARLQKVLGTKADIHNLLDHPGVTIEEAFGAVLAAPSADKVPWIITDDRASPALQCLLLRRCGVPARTDCCAWPQLRRLDPRSAQKSLPQPAAHSQRTRQRG